MKNRVGAADNRSLRHGGTSVNSKLSWHIKHCVCGADNNSLRHGGDTVGVGVADTVTPASTASSAGI
jgi:hypothetical protein